MAAQKCFDKRFADVVAGLVKGLPRLTQEALLVSVSNTALLERRLTQALCPVWNIFPETLQDQFSYPANLYCTGCMVKKEYCPAYAFDTSKLQLLTFERAGEGPISGEQRITRILKTRYLPLTTNMYASLIRRWHHKMHGLLNQTDVQDGAIVFDGLLSSNSTVYHAVSIVTPQEKKEILRNVQDGIIFFDKYMSFTIRKMNDDTFLVFVTDGLYKKQQETRRYSVVYDPS